jgi:hypothetical protein
MGRLYNILIKYCAMRKLRRLIWPIKHGLSHPSAKGQRSTAIASVDQQPSLPTSKYAQTCPKRKNPSENSSGLFIKK